MKKGMYMYRTTTCDTSYLTCHGFSLRKNEDRANGHGLGEVYDHINHLSYHTEGKLTSVEGTGITPCSRVQHCQYK